VKVSSVTPEIIDYAKYLGIEPSSEEHLFYIAKEGLKAPLPSTWKPCKSPRNGTIYYFNTQKGDMQKEHPCDDYYKELVERQRLTQQKRQQERQV